MPRNTPRNALSRPHVVPVLLSIFVLVACGSTETAPAPTPFQPQVTIFASSEAATTAASPTPEPSDTPEPQASAAVSDTSATASTVSTSDVIAIGPDINPYTGLAVTDTATLQRKPLFIKVANTAEIRPQSGLSFADVVVEHLSEGSITRFTALFLTNSPTKIGSVRSCRLIDIELPVMFDTSLVCSGTSPGVKPLMRNSYAHRNNLTMISDFGPYECARCPMFRTTDRVPPHNLFSNSLNAWKELDERGTNTPSTFRAWAFRDAAPQGKETASVDVGYRSGVITWTYDAKSGRWLRALRGDRQVDALTRQQIGASNVVVLYAHHQATLIQEDTGGSKSIEIQVWGEGPVRVFRDGREVGGKWIRNGELGHFEFLDVNGNKIPLKPGNTWIEVVPIVGDVPISTK
jgi:hypothetical protein